MRICIIIVCLISYINLFADAGLGYRFHLQLISKDSDTINGYFYHYAGTGYSYEQNLYYDEGSKNYIKKDSIKLYSFIVTTSFNDISVDFTTENYKQVIKLDEFDIVRINDFLNFGPVDRLKEITQSEFDLIRLYPPRFKELYNEDVAENCLYVLLSWENNSDLSNHSKEINEKLALFGDDIRKNQSWFYDYLNSKKTELFDDEILIINYCVPL